MGAANRTARANRRGRTNGRNVRALTRDSCVTHGAWRVLPRHEALHAASWRPSSWCSPRSAREPRPLFKKRQHDSSRVFTLLAGPWCPTPRASPPTAARSTSPTLAAGAIYKGQTLDHPTVSPFIGGTAGGSAVDLRGRPRQALRRRRRDGQDHRLRPEVPQAAGELRLRLRRLPRRPRRRRRRHLRHRLAAAHALARRARQGRGDRHLAQESPYQAGFNLNGIVEDGGDLVVVQSNTGKLFRIDDSMLRRRVS